LIKVFSLSPNRTKTPKASAPRITGAAIAEVRFFSASGDSKRFYQKRVFPPAEIAGGEGFSG
jgi:hypothetical protein